MSSTYQLTTLDNGLRIASQHMPSVQSAAISITIGVGSRFETKAQNGLSHVLEHMAFKGTTTRSAQQIAEEFEDIGGQFNAYTSVENTVYYVRSLAEHLPKATELLADIMQNSVLSEEELKREQQVILQEIAAHKDSPEDYINDLFDDLAYPNQAIGRSVLGSEETVASFTRDDVLAYMQQHYTPKNIVISAAGAVDHNAFVQLISEHFSKLHEAELEQTEATRYKGGDAFFEKDLEQTHISFGYPAPNQHHEDYYTSQLLANILGGGMSSRLFQEVREKRGLAYHVASYNVAYSDTAMMMMIAASAPEHSKLIPALMQEELEKLANHIDESELTRAKNQLLTELAMASENSASIASWIGRHLMTYGEYRTLDDIMGRITPVSVGDIKTLAADTLTKTPTLITLGK